MCARAESEKIPVVRATADGLSAAFGDDAPARFACAEDDEAVALHNRTAVNLRLGGPLDGRLHGRFARRGAALVRTAAFLGLARDRTALLGTAGGRAALLRACSESSCFLRGGSGSSCSPRAAGARCLPLRFPQARLPPRCFPTAARRTHRRRRCFPPARSLPTNRSPRRFPPALRTRPAARRCSRPRFRARRTSRRPLPHRRAVRPSAGGRTGTNKRFFSYASTSFSAEKPF